MLIYKLIKPIQKNVLISTLLCLPILTVLGQQDSTTKNKPQAFWEYGAIVSGSPTTPFWLRANQYGTVPNASPVVMGRAGIKGEFKNAHLTKKWKVLPWQWNYGVEAVAYMGRKNALMFSEAYLQAEYGWFNVYAGRKKEMVGLADSTLSSGSYIWSGNALPMPKVQIGWDEYRPIFKNGLIALKGTYAHGWFGNQTYVKNYYLHQKTLYGRLGKPNWKVHFYGGFNHQVQWGGKPKYAASAYVAPNGKFESSFKSYLNLLIGKSLVLSQGLTNPTYDNENRVGNHLGTIDLGFDLSMKNAQIFIYRQNIYEDGSLYYLANIEDGLNGLSIELSNSQYLKKIVFEYLNTSDQGKSNNSKNPTDSDSYFQHGQFQDGWTYNQQVMGTPFMLYSLENGNSLKTLRTLARENFINTRLQMYYVGLSGEFKGVRLVSKASYSRNLGSYTAKPKVEQYSYLLSAQKDINFQDTINLGFSFDTGALFKNNTGLSLSFKRIL